MIDRVIVGRNGADTGMWISAPGKSVYSTVFEDLLIDTTRINTQPLIKGIISSPNLPYNSAASVHPIIIYNSFTQAWQMLASGDAVYSIDLYHNLGFVPICHLSTLSVYAGIPYPHVYIDSTKITLRYDEYWGMNFLGGEDAKPSSITFDGDFHYTLFRQAVA